MQTPIHGSARALGVALLVGVGACTGEVPTGVPLSGSDDGNVVASVTVAPTLDSLDLGETVRLRASVLNRAGGTVAATLSWTSSATAVATVDGEGLVTAVGEGNTVITARAGGRSGSATLVILSGALAVATTTLPDGELGAAYHADLVVIGGSGDESWSIVSGALPPGLALASGSGAISGTPTAVGAATFTVRASSSDGQTATADLHVTVGPGPVTVVTGSLPAAQVGAPYDATLTATGGDGATYAWSVLAGALPAGLSLSAGGVISGTPTAEGASIVTVQAESAGRSASRDVTLSVSPAPVAGYDIELVYLSTLSATHKAAFESARSRWEQAIVADVEDVGPLSSCDSFHPATPGGVDDLVIYVTVDSIDGPFNALGEAGPCYIRANGLPITGAMTFDEADLDWLADHGQLVNTILHEMGHVLGIGTTWNRLGLRSGTCTVDPIFTGTDAVAAFDAAGGTTYTGGGKVPVENTGSQGDGSNCAHWRESVLGRELMTPTLNGSTTNPLSRITIASLGDQGYVVDPGAADGYSLPVEGPSGVAGSEGPVLRLGNDVLPTPRYLVHPDGRVEQVAPGGTIPDRER